ncbi:MAG: ABC transporter ATP-binding protein [Acidimicrobiia bacterium]|nr:ABC transporter ATP-binding protein [Acidimicrobiia bacterium]MYH73152.1 ABC transporter ATP-binding protein [Acidimicrobiia bacterium]MYJ32714.1 ABC transporter ATP-binding protein [Acidimicrobiia bacterium]
MSAPYLEVRGLKAAYGDIQVLHGIDFSVAEGQIAVILGANGAGKTTTLRALCAMVSTEGSVRLAGEELSGQRTADIVRRGVAHVPQGRGTFPDLSVEENLMAGAYVRSDADVRSDMEQWFETFPVLGERRAQAAGSLSGGEQQMLAIARALMLRPSLLLLDEPSLGLAPMITRSLFEQLTAINAAAGTTMLVVEQNASLALGVADVAYVLEAGEVALSGPADELAADDNVRRAYLGY